MVEGYSGDYHGKMSTNPATGFRTIAEYLTLEETSEQKHEYHDGEVLAMSGGTYSHARVCSNLGGMLFNRLRGSGCQHLDSNMRVATSESRRFVYPDASILCEEPRFHPDDPNETTLINPRVIFEVASELTEGYDRGDKFDQYRKIESLEEYVLIGRVSPTVQGFLRQDDGSWSMRAWEGLDAVAVVRSVGVELPLGELFEGVEGAMTKSE